MNSKVVELAKKYKQMLNGDDPTCQGRTQHRITLLFVETYIDELSKFTLDEQVEFIRLAEADPCWWISLNQQWLSPVKLEL